MKKITQLTILLTILVVPLAAAAVEGATGIDLTKVTPYSDKIINLVNDILVPVLMAVAFLAFLFGVYLYFIQGASNDESRAKGRMFTLWGIIGFVVILSLWGLVNLLMGTLGLSAGTAPSYPTIRGGTTSATGGGTGGTGGSTGGSLFGGSGGGTGGGGSGTANTGTSCAFDNAYPAVYGTCQPSSSGCSSADTSPTCTGGGICCASGGGGGTANTGVSCNGENTGTAGTCQPSSSGCSSADTSPTCTGGGICCASGGGGSATPMEACMATYSDQTICDCQVDGICPI